MMQNETQSKSAIADPESMQASPVDFNDSEFFKALDRSVNSIQFEDSDEQPENQNQVEDEAEEVTDEIENVRKAYSESSKEAKRLAAKMKELEPYIPILDAMKDDPSLVRHVRSFYESGGEAPKSLKDNLGLDEDFIFDFDEAINNPSSDSGKLFYATVDGLVQQRLSQERQHTEVNTKRIQEEAAFKQRHKMSDESYNEMIDFAKEHVITLDDIYYLMNRESRERNIAKSNAQEKISQLNKMKQTPRTLAQTGKSGAGASTIEDKIFNGIQSAISGGSIFK